MSSFGNVPFSKCSDIGFDVLFDELPGRVPDHPLFLVEVIPSS